MTKLPEKKKQELHVLGTLRISSEVFVAKSYIEPLRSIFLILNGV